MSTLAKKGSETANEEEPDTLRKIVRLEQEAPSSSLSSSTHVSLEYPVSGEKQDRPELVSLRGSGRVIDDIHISALDVFCEMEGREIRYIKEVLDWYRDEDAADVKKSELNEPDESMASDGKSEKSEKSDQDNVMDEEFVKNIVMNEEFVKKIVMNARIDSKGCDGPIHIHN